MIATRPQTRAIWPALASLFLLFTLAGGCASAPTPTEPVKEVEKVEAPPAAVTSTMELVETWPLETNLDNPDIPDAHDVWLELIKGAEETLEFEEFYGTTMQGSRLESIMEAIIDAAARGVKVRFIFDYKFYGREPVVPDLLKAIEGIEVRIIDLDKHSGGVQHAKFFIVDGAWAFVGSQNFDWRSLTHVQELGLKTNAPGLVGEIREVFEMDWRLAGGESVEEIRSARPPAGKEPVYEVDYRGAKVKVVPAFSPEKLLPDEDRWDLPKLVALINGASKRVRVQVMSYSVVNYDKSSFVELDKALRAAAGRGVAVELMFADWNKKPWAIKAIQSLQEVENITVKLVTIPQHSAGFVPYARVIHAKLMTVDGAHGWLGTSNWSGDYFTQSRNLGFIFEGEPMVKSLDGFFERTWGSDYATVVDPEATYEAPRVKE